MACALTEVVAVAVASSVLAGGAESGMDRVFHGSTEKNNHLKSIKEGSVSGLAERAGQKAALNTKKYSMLPTSELKAGMSKSWGKFGGWSIDIRFKVSEIYSDYQTKKEFNWVQEVIF